MEKIELTVLVNKVNTAKFEEVGAAHGGTFEDRRTAHALAEEAAAGADADATAVPKGLDVVDLYELYSKLVR